MNRALKTAKAALLGDTAIQVNNGVAQVTGTRIKVAQIALKYSLQGQSLRQITESYPHLSAGQVQAALNYYDSHQETVEAQISASLVYADQARKEISLSEVAAKLKEAKSSRVRQPA